MLEGYKAREEAQYRRVAWQTAHLINISQKSVRSRVTGESLLGLPAASATRTPARGTGADEPEPDAGLDFVALLNAALGGKDVRE